MQTPIAKPRSAARSFTFDVHIVAFVLLTVEYWTGIHWPIPWIIGPICILIIGFLVKVMRLSNFTGAITPKSSIAVLTWNKCLDAIILAWLIYASHNVVASLWLIMIASVIFIIKIRKQGSSK
jgi:hypothetical protein